MAYKDPEVGRQRRNARNAERRATDPAYVEKAREASRRWYATKGKEPAFVERRNRQRAYSRVKINDETYKRLLSQQGFVCAICGSPHADERGKRLHIDHCHTTGAVRGLLCSPCNMAIGQLGDNPQRIRAAADYVENAQ